jgi:tRNA threonylcarbamoyl adenosine modification protein YeaZ
MGAAVTKMILAIDTAGPNVALALGNRDNDPHTCLTTARLNHNEILDREVQALLSREKQTLDLIAVNAGPGSFTGTRVGVSYAVGLAQSLALPIFSLSSYRVAAGLAPPGTALVHVAFSVVRDTWCCCRLIRRDGDWHEASECEVDKAQLDALTECGVVVIPWGDPRKGQPSPPDWNPAATLHKLAGDTPAESFLQPHEIHVRYLGPSQAERNFHARSG